VIVRKLFSHEWRTLGSIPVNAPVIRTNCRQTPKKASMSLNKASRQPIYEVMARYPQEPLILAIKAVHPMIQSRLMVASMRPDEDIDRSHNHD